MIQVQIPVVLLKQFRPTANVCVCFCSLPAISKVAFYRSSNIFREAMGIQLGF